MRERGKLRVRRKLLSLLEGGGQPAPPAAQSMCSRVLLDPPRVMPDCIESAESSSEVGIRADVCNELGAFGRNHVL